MPNAHAGWYFTDHVVHRTIYVQGELFLPISMNAMGPGRNGISRPQSSSADQCRSIDRCKIVGGCHLARTTLPVVVAMLRGQPPLPDLLARCHLPHLFPRCFSKYLLLLPYHLVVEVVNPSLHLGSLRIFRPFLPASRNSLGSPRAT